MRSIFLCRKLSTVSRLRSCIETTARLCSNSTSRRNCCFCEGERRIKMITKFAKIQGTSFIATQCIAFTKKHGYSYRAYHTPLPKTSNVCVPIPACTANQFTLPPPANQSPHAKRTRPYIIPSSELYCARPRYRATPAARSQLQSIIAHQLTNAFKARGPNPMSVPTVSG